MKKWIFAIFVLGMVFGTVGFVFAQEKQIEINFFYSPTCSHCAQEWKFLEGLKEKSPEIKINKFSISKRDNIKLLKKFYEEYKVPSEYYGMVPVTFIDSKYFVGFTKKTGENIKNCILELSVNSCPGDCQCQEHGEPSEGEFTLVNLEGIINFPIIGTIDIGKYSLPTLAIILGILDGFNICSLGALIIILGLVLALRSRKKTLIFGGLFIFITAVVYGLLIVVWYQIFSFFAPYWKAMEILIGLLGIGGGIYFLRQFIRFKKYGPLCEASLGKGIIAKFSLKFQKSFKESGNILLLLGTVLLFASVVTIVEFPCSAAVPVVFAGVLAQSNLPAFYYLSYIALFLLFYMLDEIIVFLVAFFTMKIWLASSKAITWITLIEAIILFGLGFYYLFGFGFLM